jgi:MOSC domain-containing protein YiiM
MSGTLVAVCAVGKTHYNVRKDGATGIDKRPVDGPVRVGPLGVEGDKQYEAGHGGANQAIYAYDRAEAQRWAAKLGREVPPGAFGENFAVEGMPVTDAVIGERWLIGDPDGEGVLLEVTAPRTPCQTFQAWMGEPQWVKRFTAQADVGAYLRVLRPGTVRAGDPISVVARPAHGVTAREVFRAADTDPRRLRRLLDEGEQLHPFLVVKVSKVLDRLAVHPDR